MSPSKSRTEWLEIPIFIHGISPEENPPDHIAEYESLRSLVNKHLDAIGKPILSKTPIYVEWGRQYRGASGNDQYLAQAEQILHARIRESMGDKYTGMLPIYKAVRELIYFGVIDLFYYVSQDGEEELRNHVFNEITKKLLQLGRIKSTRVSLTFFAHSAGTLITHDLLYHYFGKKSTDEPVSKSESNLIVENMDKARNLSNPDDPEDIRIRVRRLYTFGSPISPLSVRSNSVIQMLLKDKVLDTEMIGLRSSDGLSNPRWVNFWDKDDLVSAPVAPLYDNAKKVILDQHMNAGFILPKAHTNYWFSEEMAKFIAQTY
ncbi:MAG: hypothetical protein NTW69_20490 [Chloroflexi bacterium]|nr:hypothetical protein [Chloroflexota bacterium]